MVFPLYHEKRQVIASGLRITHGHWLALMQGVWWGVSMAEELPESQHGSCTIIFQQVSTWNSWDGLVPSEENYWDGLVPSEVYSLWWSMIVGIDNGSGRWNLCVIFNQGGDCWYWLKIYMLKNLTLMRFVKIVLKYVSARFYLFFKLDMFKNKGLYFWQDSGCF